MIYYNDNDPCAAAWLRELAAQGAIGQGTIDDRSILDVLPADVAGFRQCHFFAGIGGWPYALELAGWPPEVPIWTASLPCQPFSHAGKRLGTADERHLWPVFHALVAQCRPPVIFGEQVASKAGREWLAAVRADLEALGYAVGAADLSASSVGAPHIRQRLYWCAVRLADTKSARRWADFGAVPSGQTARLQNKEGKDDRRTLKQAGRAGDCSATGGLADSGSTGLEGHQQPRQRADSQRAPSQRGGDAGGLGHANGNGREARRETASTLGHRGAVDPAGGGPWSDIYYHPCRDGKARPIPAEPSLFPLVDGAPARVGRLRGYGNAIVPQVAAAFIQSVIDVLG